MLESIRSRQDEIAAICRLHHVKRLSLFGSAVRSDFDPSRSDVDLRVEFDEMPVESYAENYFALREAFAELFGHKVDLISAKNIRNPYFRREVESTQVALSAA
jgi:predicted nucleotidyltransferase